MNQTIVISPSDVATQTMTQSTSTQLQQSEFDFMSILRIIWYIICFLKIISIAFFSRPKLTIRQRVLRKFLVSHNEIVKSFSEEDIKNMHVVLDNTTRNASSQMTPNNSKIRKSSKRVSFETQRNDYYQPKEWKQELAFFDIVNNGFVPQHPLHLHQKNDFQEKKHQEEFIQREDLLGLDQKTKEMQRQKKQGDIQGQKENISQNIVLQQKIERPQPIICEPSPQPEADPEPQDEQSPLI